MMWGVVYTTPLLFWSIWGIIRNMENEFVKEFSHYYKKIPDGVRYIDVYRVLEMFNVSDPALQHALKKLLVAGGRGHKNQEKDVNEAIVSLNRWLEMRKEENHKNGPQGTPYSNVDYFVGMNGPCEF